MEFSGIYCLHVKQNGGDIKPIQYLEYGGCERVNGKYYLIGGNYGYEKGKDYLGYHGYSMWTFVSDDPRGPFMPDAGAFCLCGHSVNCVAWLSCWARGNNELLISNYASLKPNTFHPSMLPLRKPVFDSAGHLRLGWWKGNESIKGESQPLKIHDILLEGTNSPEGYDIKLFDEQFNLCQGIVLEGKVQARVSGAGSVGQSAGI